MTASNSRPLLPWIVMSRTASISDALSGTRLKSRILSEKDELSNSVEDLLNG